MRQSRPVVRSGRLVCLWVLLGLWLSTALPAGARAEGGPPAGTLTVAHGTVDRTLTALAMVPVETVRLQEDAVRTWRNGDILRATSYVLVLLMIGGGAEWLYWCYASKGWRTIAEAAAVGAELPAPRRATLGLRRAAFGMFGVVLFVCGVLIPVSIFPWPLEVQACVVAVVLPIAAVRLVRIAAVLILSPHPRRLRLVARLDDNAPRLSLGLVALSAVLAGGFDATLVCMRMLRAPGLAAACSAVSGVIVAWLALVVLRLWGRASRHTWRAGIYPIVLTVLVLLCLALNLVGAHQIVSTMLLLVATIVAAKVAWSVVDAYTAASDASPNDVAEYRPVIKSAVRMLLFAVAIVAATQVWDLPLLELLQSPTMTGQVLLRGVNVVVVILVADLVWVWARTIIDGKLAALPAHSDGSARFATLLPLLRRVILVLLVGLAGLTTLPALGIAIAPLLAGAGVVGITVGLGAQTLVRDIVSGVFYLLEDSFRIGEYVEFGKISGTVEGISLRFLRIRHRRGAVYSVPFGEIRWLVNLSGDWALMKLEFRVPLDTDVGLASTLIEMVGAELMADPACGQHMIEPLISRGVIRTEEFNMVLSVRCMTKPNTGRFDVRREAYHRIRDAFDEHGIRIVHRASTPPGPGRHGRPAEDAGAPSVLDVSEIIHVMTTDVKPTHST
jgi:moderate conductance mechanosensitive channel